MFYERKKRSLDGDATPCKYDTSNLENLWYIFNFVSGDIVPSIADANDGIAAWKQLSYLFTDSNKTRLHYLKNKFYTSSYRNVDQWLIIYRN